MRKTYDLVLALGEACSATETLREAVLQHLSFPYDWLANAEVDTERAKHDFVTRATTVAEHFPDWIRKENLSFVASTPQSGKDVYLDKHLGLIFNHDFLSGVPFEEMFAKVNARYQKRITRLLELLAAAKHVLLVRVERPAEKLLTPPPYLFPSRIAAKPDAFSLKRIRTRRSTSSFSPSTEDGTKRICSSVKSSPGLNVSPSTTTTTRPDFPNTPFASTRRPQS